MDDKKREGEEKGKIERRCGGQGEESSSFILLHELGMSVCQSIVSSKLMTKVEAFRCSTFFYVSFFDSSNR